MSASVGERTLKDGADELVLRFELGTAGRAQAGQDLHAQARAIHDRRQARADQRRQRSGDAAAVPAAGARRQPARGRVVVLLHLHRPGHLHRGEASSRRSTSATSRRTRPTYDKSANNGWIAMVQHYFASAWLLPAVRAARVPHAEGRPTTCTRWRWCCRWAKLRPGASKSPGSDAVRRAAGREQAGRAGAGAGPGQGLRLVHDPGQAAVLAARQAAHGARQLGLVDRRAGGAAEDRVLLAECAAPTARWRR